MKRVPPPVLERPVPYTEFVIVPEAPLPEEVPLRLSVRDVQALVGPARSSDRLLVRRIEEQETVRGGIIIPDTAKEKPMQGKVIAVGKGRVEKDGKVTPLDVKAGDTVLFGKYAGQEIKIEGNEYLIIREEEVLGVIEK